MNLAILHQIAQIQIIQTGIKGMKEDKMKFKSVLNACNQDISLQIVHQIIREIKEIIVIKDIKAIIRVKMKKGSRVIQDFDVLSVMMISIWQTNARKERIKENSLKRKEKIIIAGKSVDNVETKGDIQKIHPVRWSEEIKINLLIE